MMEEAQKNSCQPSSKITPLQLREQYHLNIADLAYKAEELRQQHLIDALSFGRSRR